MKAQTFSPEKICHLQAGPTPAFSFNPWHSTNFVNSGKWPLPVCFPPRWRIQKAAEWKQGELFPSPLPALQVAIHCPGPMVLFGSWHRVPRPLLCRVTPWGQLLRRGCQGPLPNLPLSPMAAWQDSQVFPSGLMNSYTSFSTQPPCPLECLCFS